MSVAEVEHQDLWQRAAIAVALVGAEEYHLRRVMHEVEKRVDAWGEVEVIDRDLQAVVARGLSERRVPWTHAAGSTDRARR